MQISSPVVTPCSFSVSFYFIFPNYFQDVTYSAVPPMHIVSAYMLLKFSECISTILKANGGEKIEFANKREKSSP